MGWLGIHMTPVGPMPDCAELIVEPLSVAVPGNHAIGSQFGPSVVRLKSSAFGSGPGSVVVVTLPGTPIPAGPQRAVGGPQVTRVGCAASSPATRSARSTAGARIAGQGGVAALHAGRVQEPQLLAFRPLDV